jgi:pyrimidine-specific ribonucleoside hydrolase
MKTTYFKTTVVLLLSIFVSYCSTRQTPLIIDTDAGIDDFRALCLLFASPSLAIKAIITSDGNVDPCIGALKVRNLAISLHKDSLPIGFGEASLAKFPRWRKFAQSFSWGASSLYGGGFKKSLLLLETQCSTDTIPVTFVCLGPLTNIAAFINKFPDKKSRLTKIVWFCDRNKKRSFNYYADSGSAQSVLSSGITVDIVNPCKGISLNALENLPGDLVNNVYASAFYGGLKRTRDKGHRPDAFDDFVSLYLNYPALFKQTHSTNALVRNFVFKGTSKTFCERMLNIFTLKLEP